MLLPCLFDHGGEIFDGDFVICFFSQELENLRKQAEIIPQLMSECESVTEKLQVGLKQPEIRQTPQLFYFEAIQEP